MNAAIDLLAVMNREGEKEGQDGLFAKVHSLSQETPLACAAEISENLFVAATNGAKRHSPALYDFGVLVLSDDVGVVELVRKVVGVDMAKGYPIYWCDTLDEAFDTLAKYPISVLVSEIRLDGNDISEGIRTLKQWYPEILTIIPTAFKDTAMLRNLQNLDRGQTMKEATIHLELGGYTFTAPVFQVGVEVIDTQHDQWMKKLESLDRIVDTCENGIVDEYFGDLHLLITKHSLDEAQILARTRTFDLDGYEQECELSLIHLERLREEFRCGKYQVRSDLMDSLWQLTLNHIIEEGSQYSSFLSLSPLGEFSLPAVVNNSQNAI